MLPSPGGRAGPRGGPTPSRLLAAVAASHAGATPSFTTYYGPGRSATVYFTDQAGGSYVASLNPYTGQVLHEQDLRTDFFSIVQALHMYLLLPPALGEWVVGVAIAIFLGMLGTGLVLWWPKRRQERRQRLTIKWGAKWRRLNYDLHTGQLLGLGGKIVAFLISLVSASLPITGTGLWWGRRHKQPRRKPALAAAS